MGRNYDTIMASALGQDGISSVNKFGYNPAIAGSATETIWAEGGTYVYPPAATIMKISSSSTDDTGAGTGAQTVKLEGLDADYNEISEIVTMDGQTEVLTDNEYLRVFRVIVLTVGANATKTNEGDIYVGVGTVTTGVPATVYAKVVLGEGQTTMAIYTVPAGKIALITSASASSDRNETVTAQLFAIPFGGALNLKQKLDVFQQPWQQFYKPPIAIDEKTDIEIRGTAGPSSAMVSGKFDIILVPSV